jgi:ribosomal protein L40E
MFVCKQCNTEVTAGISNCPSCGCDVVENYLVNCISCGKQNKGGNRFCSACGALLPMIKKPICIICGTQNTPGAKFCYNCGGPILMTEDTHTEADIIEQRKQKMRADLIEKERLKAVDEEVAKRRQKITAEELKSRDNIMQREREFDEYIHEKAKKLERYKTLLEEIDSPDATKLKKLAKGVRLYSWFLSVPFNELSEEQKKEALFVCPVCGAENSLDAKNCYACGREKRRTIELEKKGKIVKIKNFGAMNKKVVKPPIAPDISDVPRPELDDILDNARSISQTLADERRSEIRNGAYGASQRHPLEFGQPARQAFAQSAYPQNGYAQNFEQYAPQENQRLPQEQDAQPQQPPRQTEPAFANAKPSEPYQMPPIIQPVAFVPYVTQDQPLLQYAEGEEISGAKK